MGAGGAILGGMNREGLPEKVNFRRLREMREQGLCLSSEESTFQERKHGKHNCSEAEMSLEHWKKERKPIR